MIENLNARMATVVVVLGLALATFAPNVVDFGESWWISKDKIVYGLDIQGGLHLVMGVDVEGVIKEETERFATSLADYMKESNNEVKEVKTLNASVGELLVSLGDAADGEKAQAFIEENYRGQLQVLGLEGADLTVRYYDAYLQDRKKKVVGQSIETLRNRIDEFGVAEPSITAQGDRRILVQLPGVKDAAKAKDLINRTARLEFMLVDKEQDQAKLDGWIREAEEKGGYQLGKDMPYSDYIKKLNADIKDKLPKGTVVYFERAPNARTLEAGAIPYLLRTDTDLGGDELKDAYVTNDEYGAWQVALNFNPVGGKKFGDLTGNNVGRLMAIVLDNVIYSAPSIQSKIPNGRAVITLGRGTGSEDVLQEAQLIATALRAGALPASLEQLEERTVGPTLGADSIAKGKQAGMIGGILVLIFMLIYYKVSGVIANIALACNILLTLAVLTSLGATLTLPGVAGIVLTVGMAVDANVIIFERIKEELAKGASFSMALKDGYARAFSAIFDGNITTAAVCFVLMYYGTGPVRGFAVTLLIGIAATMFSAIFITRTIFEVMLGKAKMEKVSI